MSSSPDRIAAGWVAHLDVDLELAQRMLRLQPAERPVPPGGLPAVWTQDWDGELVELLPAVPDPSAAPVRRVGAYARRSAVSTS